MLPLPANVTCDIYRNANNPPASPDVATVAGHLIAAYQRALEAGESRSAGDRYDYVLSVDVSVDVRDGYNVGSVAQADKAYIPDQNGVKYWVRFVERRGRGTPHDHKRVYLCRDAVTWPTSSGI
jgi:hypothetical protein